MKWSHESKVIALLCCNYLAVLVNGQGYYHQGGGFQPSVGWPNGAPYISSSMFEPQKAASFPLNHYSHGPHNSQKYMNSFPNQRHQQHSQYSGAASQEQPVAALYSGYYYVQDKEQQQPHHHHIQQQPTTPNHIGSVPHFSSLNSYYHQQSQPFASPSFHHQRSAMLPPPPLAQLSPQFRFPIAHPSPLTAASPSNTETYREAIDLFSEVVQKLEKESGGLQPGARYLLAPLSNGLSNNASPTSTSGFPHHLDHIMGPEFLQRAEKLYSKIIKEQSERLQRPPPAVPVRSTHSYPGTFHRNDYMKQAYQNSGISAGIYGPGRPSYFARNLIADSLNPSGSLVDTVKSLELNVPNRRESRDELMQTAESGSIRASPSIPSRSTQTKVDDEIKTETELLFATEQVEANYGKKLAMKPKPNNFVEHPLPYDEYEGLIKDIL